MKDFYLRISIFLGKKLPIELSIGYIENKVFINFNHFMIKL